MSNMQLQHFMTEVESLCEDDKLKLVTIILDSMRSSSRKVLDDDTVLGLFDKFTGCIQSEKQIDCRSEINSYLDERFGA